MSDSRKKGFAAMTPERRQEVSRKGGQSNKGQHRWTAAEAKVASAKGLSVRREKRA